MKKSFIIIIVICTLLALMLFVVKHEQWRISSSDDGVTQAKIHSKERV